MVNKLDGGAVSATTIEAFHTMWGNFPHGVLLLKGSREIVAANKKSKESGAIEGRKCFQLGGLTDIHKGCLGNCALEEGTVQRRTYHDKTDGKVVDAYWLPVPSDENLMLHFAVYIDPATDC
jgi:hypothetical protein|tara:strand:- start:2302 stop:2667 length:366 start_codon:yes stop_codon:yes gene_type:complete